MANPIICSIDGVEHATWIIGDMNAAEQYPLCDACIIGWMLAKLDADLTPDGKAHVAGMWAPAPAPPSAEDGPAGDAPKSGPGRPGRRRRAGGGQNQASTEIDDDQAAREAQAAAEATGRHDQAAAADAS